MQPNVGTLAVFPNAEDLAVATANALQDLANAHSAAEHPLRIALSGGSTPKRLYQLLAQRQLPWDRIEWYWGDERNVPLEHVDSNYRMAKEMLFDHVPVPSSMIHPVPIDVANPEQTAATYASLLNTWAEPDNFPQFDVVLLGMGDDGHTASLFPETTALEETHRCFVSNWVQKFDTHRLTLSAPAINAAKRVWFVIAGQNKRAALSEVWAREGDSRAYPSRMIQPTSGELKWLVTADALPNQD